MSPHVASCLHSAVCLQGHCVCRGEGGTQPPNLASTAEATARHSRSIFLPAGTSHYQHYYIEGQYYVASLLKVLTAHQRLSAPPAEPPDCPDPGGPATNVSPLTITGRWLPHLGDGVAEHVEDGGVGEVEDPEDGQVVEGGGGGVGGVHQHPVPPQQRAQLLPQHVTPPHVAPAQGAVFSAGAGGDSQYVDAHLEMLDSGKTNLSPMAVRRAGRVCTLRPRHHRTSSR